MSSSLLLDLIDFRSFSNLWYWIGLCVLWSSASHWVIGVPYDMVSRARREEGAALAALETLVAINSQRLLGQSRAHGVWAIGVLAFLFTSLFLLAALYGSEFALALLLILLPLAILAYVTLRACLKIEAGEGQGTALLRRLLLTRVTVQALGLASIFVASMVGMYVNLLNFISK